MSAYIRGMSEDFFAVSTVSLRTSDGHSDDKISPCT